MSISYTPDALAIPSYPWNITFLSQRDVAVQIPVNYVTEPGVGLTAACFADNRYEDYAAALCFANLLATGFRRFDVDLFWDENKSLWSLCPVQIPTRSETASSLVAIPTTSISQSNAQTTATTSLPTATMTETTSGAVSSAMAIRQETLMPEIDASLSNSTTVTSQVQWTTATVVTTTSANSTFAVLPSATPSLGEEVMYAIGPYTCTSSINITMLTTVMAQYLLATDTDIAFVANYMLFNLHAAASALHPNQPASRPENSRMPQPQELIGTLFSKAVSSSLYTPTVLDNQRSDINASWFDKGSTVPPDVRYLSFDTVNDGVMSSPDGWPNAGYMELVGSRRLFLGYGTVDPQMEGYNFSSDGANVFSRQYLANSIGVTTASDGSLTSGCIYQQNQYSLSSANSSWAITSNIPPLNLGGPQYNATLASIANMAACGISPFLNATLASTTADLDLRPYREFAYSAIWSWAPGEPLNTTAPNDRCAAIDPSGRWHVADCTRNLRSACRGDSNASPYSFAISKDAGPYIQGPASCPTNTTFAVPRTALENRYLLEAYRRSGDIGANGDAVLWINFNDLDVQTCWVAGVNSTCAYAVGIPKGIAVTVPTVAAVIILVIAGLLILVKCAGNRTSSRTRRRGGDGWDYEGVPA